MSAVVATWPREEPLWIDFAYGYPLLAPTRFLAHWKGYEDQECSNLLDSAIGERCGLVSAWQTSAILFGDFQSVVAPAIGRLEADADRQIGLIWKWISVPDGFQLPTPIEVARPPDGSVALRVEPDVYYLCGTNEVGTEAMERCDVPRFKFHPGDHRVDWWDLRLPSASSGTANFWLFAISAQLTGFEWEPEHVSGD